MGGETPPRRAAAALRRRRPYCVWPLPRLSLSRGYHITSPCVQPAVHRPAAPGPAVVKERCLVESPNSEVREFIVHSSSLCTSCHACSPLSSQVRWPRRSATLAPCAGRRLRGRPGAARAAHRAAARQQQFVCHLGSLASCPRSSSRQTATAPHSHNAAPHLLQRQVLRRQRLRVPVRAAAAPRPPRMRESSRADNQRAILRAGMSSCRRT